MLIKDKKNLTTGSKFLLLLLEIGYYNGLVQDFTKMRNAVYPELTIYRARRRLNSITHKLKKKGWIDHKYKEGKRIIKLTKKGELEALFAKAHLPSGLKKWDGKWRMIIFDIPESARDVRDKLRKLLKEFGFKPIQASVYINPFPLNTAAVTYLKQSGLTRYIRIFRADQFDTTKDLKKTFKL